MNRCKTMHLFTNRNCCAFDENGEQIVEYQRAINCYDIDPEMAMQATEEAENFYISKWREWNQAISRIEMQYLLGLRTRMMDMQDNKRAEEEMEKMSFGGKK